MASLPISPPEPRVSHVLTRPWRPLRHGLIAISPPEPRVSRVLPRPWRPLRHGLFAISPPSRGCRGSRPPWRPLRHGLIAISPPKPQGYRAFSPAHGGHCVARLSRPMAAFASDPDGVARGHVVQPAG